MAGIFVNVNDDVLNLRKLKAEIENVKKALKGIDVKVDINIKEGLEAQLRSLTEQYDALADKISETEGKIRISTERINEATKKIVEAQNKLIGATQSQGSVQQPGVSAPVETASVQAQAKAYDDLKTEIDAVLGSRSENIKRMVEEQNAIRLINAELKKMEKASMGGNYSSAQLKRIEQLNNSLMTHKAALAEVRQVLNNNAKIDNAAADSMTRLAKELERMKMAYRELTLEEQNSPFGKELLASISQVDAKMKELDASIGNHQRNIGNYGSSFNGLNVSVQQLVRELPSAAMGLNTFFLAISNNIPILVDEINRARQANAALEKSARTPVWKQVASSLFSWQTALMAGIALLSVYGKDLAKWVSGLWEGKEAATGLKEAQDKINESFKENSGGLGEQIALVKKLGVEWNALGGDLDKQKKFIEENKSEFDKLGVSVNNAKDAENLLVRNTQTFIDSLVRRAKAAAGIKLAAEAYEEAIKKQMEVDKMADKIRVKETMTVQSVAGASTVSTGREIEIDNKQKKLLQEDVDALNAKAEAYLNVVVAQEQLAKQELENAGIKTKADDETKKQIKNVKDMSAQIQAMVKQNAQDEIRLEKDLSKQRQMQIEHDYQERMRLIDKFEKELTEHRKGNLTDDDKNLISQARKNAEAIKQQQQEANNQKKLLEQYKGYFEQRKSIEEKYNKDRETLISEGASQEALDENEYQKNEALNKIDMMFAQREEEFRIWAAQVVNVSLEELENLVLEAESMIEDMEKNDPNNKDISKVRAGLQVVKGEIENRKSKGEGETPDPKASEEWKELYETLRKVEKQFSEIGDAVGGTVGEIISTAGSVASSTITMVEGIVRLTDGSINAIQGTSKAATTALQTVERASVILAIVGAALQIATKIANMFGADYSNYNKAKENYEAYVEVLDDVISKQKELIETMTGKAAVEASEDAIELIKKQAEAAKELGKMRLNAGASIGSHSIGVRIQKNMTQEGWEQALDSLGAAYYNKIREGRMEGLFDLTIEQLEKLKTDAPLFWAQLDGDVRNYLEQMIESNDAAEQIGKTLQESLTGLSFEDFSGDILDSLYDLEKSAEDIFDDMSDYMRKSMIKAMYVKNYEPQMKQWYEQWSKAMEDGVMSTEEKNSLDALKESIIKGATEAAQNINSMFERNGESEEANEDYETFVSNMKNSLMSVELTAKDVSDNIYDYFRQAMINSLYDKSYKSLMEQLYNDYEQMMSDGGLSEGDMNELSKKVDDYVNQMTEGVGKVNELFADKLKEAEQETDLDDAFKSFSDSVLSAMKSAEVEASKIAESIADNMREELIEAMYVELYEPRIKEIWEKWKSITADGLVTDEERASIQAEIQSISDEVAGAAKDITDNWIDAGEEVNQAFKSFSDSIKSVLYDAEATAEDVAKNIYKFMRNAFIDASFASQIEPLTKEWFDLYESFNVDKVISSDERAQLDKLLGDISKAGEELNAAANKLFPTLDTGAQKAAEEAARKAEEAAEKARAESERIREEEESKWESFSDDILNSLTDIETTSADISQSMGETMRKALIKAMYVKNYEPQMKKWYESWQKAMGDGTLSDDEKSTLDTMKDTIINDAMKEVNAINQMFGSMYSQKATSKGFSAMNQETGEELNGRFTALQISNEEIKRNVTLLNITANDIKEIQMRMNDITSGIQDQLANSYLELVAINENTGLSAKYLKDIKSDISEVKNNLKNL